jgi:hypothetical protein
VTIKFTQPHYCFHSGILPLLTEIIFALRIKACRSIIGNDLLQRSDSLLMAGNYNLPADAKVWSIAYVSRFRIGDVTLQP